MTLADTSALVEFLRGAAGAARARVRAAIDEEAIAVTDAVAMELLAGARDEAHVREISNFIAGASYVPTGGLDAWEAAATVYRRCRRAGFTPRSQLDCLIAAIGIRERMPVLHADRDFDEIARHTPLRVLPLN